MLSAGGATASWQPRRPGSAAAASASASDAQRPHRGGVVVCPLLLVLLDAPIELVREQIDGRVHVFLGCVRVDGTTAHVERCLGLLSQLLHRQYAVYVDHLIEMPANAFQFLLHIAPQ